MGIPAIGPITTTTFAQAFTRVRRATAARDAAGNTVPGAQTSTAGKGTVSVPRADDVEPDLRGRISEGGIRISTMLELRASKAGAGGHRPDLVVYNGQTYEVVKVKDVLFSRHYSAICAHVAHEGDGEPL